MPLTPIANAVIDGGAEGGTQTTTFSNNGQLPYMWGSEHYIADNAEVTYVHSLSLDKGMQMLSFKLVPNGREDWNNSWTNDRGWDATAGGWPYSGNDGGPPAEPGVSYHIEDQYFKIGGALFCYPEVETVTMLPYLTIEAHQSKDGTYVETIWDEKHTQAIQFIYDGPDRNKLIQRTYGHMENAKWVQTTTRPETLADWILNRLKDGGNKVTRGNAPFSYLVETPKIHWPIDTNPDFLQNWSGYIYLTLQKGDTIDGVDQYSLTKIESSVEWWHCRDDGIWHEGGDKPLSTLGVTEEDLKAIISKWNEKAVLEFSPGPGLGMGIAASAEGGLL